MNEIRTNNRFYNVNETDIVANKTCPFCPTAVEDETHVIFVCPKYDLLRKKYLENICDKREYTVTSVLMEPSVESNRKLGMYLFYALKLREETI